MKCSKVKDLIDAYIDNNLEPEMMNIVKEHLLTCNDCQDEVTFFEKYQGVIASLEKVAAPDDFLEKVHQRIMEPSRFQQIIRKLFIPVKIKIPLEVAGVLAMAFFVIFFFKSFEPVKREIQFTKGDRLLRISKKQEKKNGIAVQSKNKHVSLPIEKRAVNAKSGAKRILKTSKKFKTYEIALLITPSVHVKYKSPEVAISAKSYKDVMLRGSETSKFEREKMDNTIEDTERVEVLKSKSKIDKKEKDLRDYPKYKPIIKIRHLIGSLEGRIINEEYSHDSKLIKSIIMEIPFNNYKVFIDELSRVGRIQKKPSSIGIEETRRIKLKIEFVSLN